MKRIAGMTALVAVAALLASIPTLSNAAGPVPGSCTIAKPKPYPAPPSGATASHDMAPLDPAGKAWINKNAANTAGQVGSAGTHGYFVGDVNSTTSSASAKGYSTDSGVNGYANANSTSPSACVSANGNKVAVAPVAKGTCTVAKPTPYPAPPKDATASHDLNPVDPKGKAWVNKNATNTAAQAGSAGTHGWLVGNASSTTSSASVKGYSTDSNVNGDLEANNSKPSACVGANGQKVTVS